ncbi:phage integrase SAM-like domain-containing protein [Dyadobacter flavalbus]|nr:phage integrase SAM-like domain-containing protein [Dyadobacter flavalbus]
MRIRFVIRKVRTNSAGVCPLNCRITIDGQKATEFATGAAVDPKKWDSKFQKVKGASQAAIDLNRRIDIIKTELEGVYLSARSRGLRLSANEIKDIYTGKKELACSFVKMTTLYLEELKIKNRSIVTVNRYKRCFLYLNQYLGKDMNVASLEKRHVSGFWRWLKEKGYHNDYCNKIVQACIGLFRFGMREGYVERSPFAGVSLEWKKELDTTCLSKEELGLLENYPWSDKLQRVVDSFLFMCHTGLHIGDYIEIGEDSCYTYNEKQFMKVKRIKTGVEAIFPLDNFAVSLINKYGGCDKMPKISGQKSNDYLKVIAEAVGITKNLTNKIARKTFTDICLNEYGFSDEVVSTMLGHTSTRQIKHYGSIKEKRILKEWSDKVDVA